jgi:hypothetical protein
MTDKLYRLPEAEFLDEIQTKVFRVCLLVIHSHLYSLAVRCLFLQTHATSYSFNSSVTVKKKRGKPGRKPYHGLRNPYRNLKSESENSQDYAQKPHQNCIRLQRQWQQNCHRYQGHRRQIFPPFLLALLIPVANLPQVSTIQAANLPPVSTTPVANNGNNYQTADNLK